MDPPFQILFYCRNTKDYSDLVEELAKKYFVVLACNFEMVFSLPDNCPYKLVMIEIPSAQQEFTKALESIFSKCPSPRIVAFDGDPSQKILAEAFRLGMLDYFSKPVDYNLLLERVEVLIRNT